MKNLIYYFSGTGNSLKVARELARGLGETELVPVTRGIRDAAEREADRIGLVFPVYMYRPPRIVTEFIDTLETRSYLFAVATCGGDAGDLVSRLRRACRAAGSELRAAFAVPMVSNYTPMMPPPPPEELRARFAEADEKIKQILEVVGARRSGFDRDGSFFKTKIHPGLLYRVGYKMIPRLDGEFRVDGTCNACGLCAKVCPVNNIALEEGKPSWKHGCEQCFACLQWCPKEAIQYGKDTAGKARYRHPDVTAGEIMVQQNQLVCVPAGGQR